MTASQANGRYISWGSAFLMLASLLPHFWCHTGDDLSFLVLPQPNTAIAQVFATSGRYLSSLLYVVLEALGIDVMRDFPLMAALCAIAFGVFARAAAAYLWPAHGAGPAVALGAALFCLNGLQVDLNSFKLQYAVSALMYLLMTAYLVVVSGRGSRAWRLFGALGLLLAINFVYQAGTMALAWMAVAKTTIQLATRREGDAESRPSYGEMGRHVAVTAALVVTAGVGFLLVSTWIQSAYAIPVAKGFVSADALPARAAEHARAVATMLRPLPGRSPIGLLNGGAAPLVWGALAGLITWNLLRERRLADALLTAAAIASLALLLQNPQNLTVATYWPTPRTSFYASLMTPVLAAAAAASGPPSARPRALALAMVALLLAVAATTRVVVDRHELMRRDLALATEIAFRIGNTTEFDGVTGVRFPRGGEVPYERFFSGMPTNYVLASLLAIPWAQAPLLQYVGGPALPRTGDSACPAAPEEFLRRPSLRREGDDLVVCY